MAAVFRARSNTTMKIVGEEERGARYLRSGKDEIKGLARDMASAECRVRRATGLS